MKIRNPRLIAFLGWLGAKLIRIWLATVRYDYQTFGDDARPERLGPDQRYIYAFWHEYILLLAYRYGRKDVHVLISQHADGQLIAEICRHLGFSLIRGSSTRGGVEAVRQMMRAGGAEHLAITPDGPRGPRRHVQPGLVYLAARTGLPIIPIGLGFRRPWRAGSWDRFAVPRWFSRSTCVLAPAVLVPPEADREMLESLRLEVETRMNWATQVAEQWAETGGPCPAVSFSSGNMNGGGELAA